MVSKDRWNPQIPAVLFFMGTLSCPDKADDATFFKKNRGWA